MSHELRVGVVDSGYGGAQAASVDAALGFALGEDLCVHEHVATPDKLGHGSAVLAHILHAAPGARFCVAQVFHERPVTSAAQIASAVRWLIAQRVRIINLSLGVRADRNALREACEEAVEAGIVVCASSPAQGAGVFPASYPGVVRVTGDARCAAHQWSWLDTAQADFGAVVKGQTQHMPGMANERGAPAGASIATAALSGHLAARLMLDPAADRDALLAHLRAHAAFIGAERRSLAS
ncbi:S8 family serine peptidase [Paraburkholderia pallida]|uniref:Peptidase S8 and S53 subtilisin kexin sedolisin n=1 Tax=Paraburkholderia pallida TaxID=2547399 RepID=A0A4V1B0M0_9BURK|nr:S8 family serine peptidase [Paraburkholderia pallida]QBR03243.1 peptidase S8 and S53 subtilisin kexin sedolisin [Paraburkholderia pallida]